MVGWEKNEHGKLAPRVVNLSRTMDPVKYVCFCFVYCACLLMFTIVFTFAYEHLHTLIM